MKRFGMATYEANGIKYKVEVTHVDADTGEILTPQKAKNKNKYIKIKSVKNETVKTGNTTATVRWITIYRRNRQIALYKEGNARHTIPKNKRRK